MSDDRFSEAGQEFDPDKLTPAQRKVWETSRAVLAPDFVPDEEVKGIMEGDGLVASYKIEVHFTTNRTSNGPNTVLIQTWQSGKFLNGGGDDLMYWCRDTDSEDGCGGIISGESIRGGMAWCPHCGLISNAQRLTGQVIINPTTRNLAKFAAGLWYHLKRNADIYCKYHQEDIRYKICEQKVGATEARKLRGLFIYPLENIIKDTSAGASVEDRFYAFFSA